MIKNSQGWDKLAKAGMRGWTWMAVAPLVVLAGCSTTTANNRRSEDPLLGGNVSSPRGQTRTASAPTPLSTSGRSTASLAADSRSRLSQENSLAIPNRSGTSTNQPVRQASWTNNSPELAAARKKLQAKGITWQDSQNRDGVWCYRCGVPNPKDPAKTRVYEAEADDELGAMLAVLGQMEKGL